MIDHKVLLEITGIEAGADVAFGGIGNLSTTSIPDMLSWLLDPKYLGELEANSRIRGVITTQELAELLPGGVERLVHPDPMIVVEQLVRRQVALADVDYPTVIDPSASIHRLADVSPVNVRIGAGTVVEANATIARNVVIGERCMIRAGAVVGADNFGMFRSMAGRVCGTPSADRVVLGDDVEIGCNTCIDRGDSSTDTVVGSGTKIHAQCQICHGVSIGSEVIFWGGVFVCGFARIGDRVQIQPRSLVSNHVVIGDEAYIGINSVVTKNVAARQAFLGVRTLGSKDTMDRLGKLTRN